MTELSWIHICEYALLDRFNKLSLIGEFTSIYFPQFPATLPVMFVVTRWVGPEGTTFNESIQIVDASNEPIIKTDYPPAEITTSRLTNIRRFEFLRFPSPGKYDIRVYANGRSVGTEGFFARMHGEKHD